MFCFAVFYRIKNQVYCEFLSVVIFSRLKQAHAHRAGNYEFTAKEKLKKIYLPTYFITITVFTKSI